MSATTVSGWSEEKPKHVRDVASALRARVREEGCNSLEECERFRDLAEFTKLSWEILYTKNRRPARSFHHNERFRNMVRRAYHELEAEDDVAAADVAAAADVDVAEAEKTRSTKKINLASRARRLARAVESVRHGGSRRVVRVHVVF